MIKILPLSCKIQAKIKAPPSKGHTLRALFISALAKGKNNFKRTAFGSRSDLCY